MKKKRHAKTLTALSRFFKWSSEWSKEFPEPPLFIWMRSTLLLMLYKFVFDVVHREGEHHSFSDCTGRPASPDRRSFTRLPSSASDMEGTVAKVGAATQLIRRFWLLRWRRCDHLSGCDLAVVLLRQRGRRGKQLREWKNGIVLGLCNVCVCVHQVCVIIKGGQYS